MTIKRTFLLAGTLLLTGCGYRAPLYQSYIPEVKDTTEYPGVRLAYKELAALMEKDTGIGDGAIIGANSVVASDVAPYTIVAGNPAKLIRKRFDNELIDIMLKFKWWDKSIEEINNLIPILTSGDLKKVKAELKARLV